MSGFASTVDPDGLLEYSVVYTDRALNHMSAAFQDVMRAISDTLNRVYGAAATVVVPGSGTFGMESVARQFAQNRRCLILRNGWFSFRWTQILDMGGITSAAGVLKAVPVDQDRRPAFAPAPVEEVVARIRADEPDLVFAPHVETSSGMILPDEYVATVGAAVRDAGGLFVLDCIASGAIWVDMATASVDVLISAPQKGWSGSPCCGLVMLGERAVDRLPETTSSSFALDLKKWRQIMEAYENGGHAYHATMPTDALRTFRQVMDETEALGLEVARDKQRELGERVRSLLVGHGFKSVAAEGFQAPGVVVSYTDEERIRSGQAFAEAGIQVAAGVPLRCDEPDDFKTFRVGLFGLDKLQHVDRTVETLETALQRIA